MKNFEHLRKVGIRKFMKQIRILNKKERGFLAFHVIKNKE